MTRSPWTSNDQKEWLESRKMEYLAANINKTATKEFFPTVFKEFGEKWPVPPVTQEELNEADGSIELANKKKGRSMTRYEHDRMTESQKKKNSSFSSASGNGFITINDM